MIQKRVFGNLEITQFKAIKDNYIYILRDTLSDLRAVIDPGDADAVLSVLKNPKLDFIVCTHHHPDHTAGNLAIQAKTKCKIVGPIHPNEQVPGVQVDLPDGGEFYLGSIKMKIMAAPGHTMSHRLLWLEAQKVLFCGDVLFSLGCGRVFTGRYDLMWETLQKIRMLPPETHIFCGHEYTLANAIFALAVDPNNQKLMEMHRRAEEATKRGQPTIPTLLSAELEANPFLRVESPDILAKIGMQGQTALEVFTALRKVKDTFPGIPN